MTDEHDRETTPRGDALDPERDSIDPFVRTTQVDGETLLDVRGGICPRCLRRYDVGQTQCPSDGHQLYQIDRAESDRIGDVIEGRLTLLGLLGTGGMGTVFRALQHSMEREVAVKLLRRTFSADPGLVKRFLREARSVSRLTHPNIISVFDFGQTDEGELFLVMELLRGRSLRQVLREEGPLSPERTMTLAVQICDALQAAHDLEVIHCDIKPDNVFVIQGAGHFGEFVKVIDFGLAKVIRPDASISDANAMLDGTPAYMSPEQIVGQKVDRRADIYAMGVVIYEMLTGHLPFRSTQPTQMLLAHVLHTPRPMGEVHPDPSRPEALETLVMEALAKDPAKRPTSALEIKRRLRRALVPTSSLSPQVGLRASTEPPDRISRLPSIETSFVGRERDLDGLASLFLQDRRLVTILGPAGMGKTRLAIRFASDRSANEAATPWRGVRFCDLTEARDLDHLCQAVARALELPLLGGQTSRETAEQLGFALALQGRILLILDNFEQIVDLAPASVARWLVAAPEARFLVTSRTVLNVPGEQVYDLPPLSLPQGTDHEELSEAEELFIVRAQAARSGWIPKEGDRAAIAAIVRGLDGIPLAIELAAARINLLSPSKLLGRLEARLDLLARGAPGDRAARQATLRAAIEWSWDLLQPWEQTALAQLSVFRGGFTLEAAEAVLDLTGLEGALEGAPWEGDALQSLREKSLIHASEPAELEGDLRFGLYESIRCFARERREALDRTEELLARHRDYYLDLGERVAREAEGPRGVSALDLLAMERENLMAVHRRALGSPGPSEAGAERGSTAALRAILCLDPLLSVRGPFAAHVQLLDRSLEAAEGGDAPPDLVARALHARGEAYRARGLLSEATADLERALELARRAGDRWTEGRLLWNLGVVADSEGDLDRALETLNLALEVQREVDDRVWEGRTVGTQGIMAFWRGQNDKAREHIERALMILHEAGDRRFEGYFMGTLGAIHQESGALNEARLHYERALRLLREVGGRRHEGMFLGYLGGLEWEQGRFGEARRRLNQALEIAREVGDRRHMGLFLAMLSGLEAADDELAKAASGFDEAEAILRSVGDRAYQGVINLHRGHLELALGRRALVIGPGDEAAALRHAAEQRILSAEQVRADSRPLTRRSDDIRFALRMLKRALDWQPKDL